MPVILCTQETKISRIKIQGPLGKKVSNTSTQPKKKQKKNLGMVAHTCHPSYTESINRSISVQVDLGIHKRSYSKNKKKLKRAGGVAPVVEHMHSQPQGPEFKLQYSSQQKSRQGWVWWLTPIIPAIQEEHSSRPTQAKVSKTPSLQISQWWYMAIIPAM
jgi:hypothetical protein